MNGNTDEFDYTTVDIIELCEQAVKAHYQWQISDIQNRLARFETINWPLMNATFAKRFDQQPPDTSALITETVTWVEKTLN